MNLTSKEIDYLKQLILNEQNAILKRIDELEQTINQDDDPLYLNEYLPEVIKSKKEYNRELEQIYIKLQYIDK
jgi:hypothetical protein